MKEFDAIIGYEEIKEELEQVADVLRNSARYAAKGVKAPRGLLLEGEPGLGKSLMAECLIKASGRRAFTCRKDRPDGEFVDAIKAVFDEAAANEPSIVYLDDMDKFADTEKYYRNAEEYVAVQSCIDAAKERDVFVLATANEPRCLPESLLRAGRFDRRIEVGAPCKDDAVEIIGGYLAGKPIADDIDTAFIADILDGRSCAILETAMNEAGIMAGHAGDGAINMDCLVRACLKTIGTAPSTNCFIDPDWAPEDIGNHTSLRSFVSFHEAGHAVVSEVLEPGSVTFMTNTLYQGRRRGNTAHRGNGGQAGFARDEFEIVMGLGGMAGTDCRFGTHGEGTNSDRVKTYRKVMTSMSQEGRAGFAYTDHFGGGGNSEQRQAALEHAANVEMERYYAKAKRIVALNREFLEKLATALAEKGLLLASDIQAIRETCDIVPVAL